MTTKSFRAETILEALQMVQNEMGPDAVVISARNIPVGPAWQVWKKPGVEVISMTADDAEKAKKSVRSGDKTPNPDAGHTDRKTPNTQAVLQPSKNGTGIEFVEERPEIEWETAPADRPDRTVFPPALKGGKSGYPTSAEAKTTWQPRYLRREDVRAMNQNLAVKEDEANETPELQISVETTEPETIKALPTEEQYPNVLKLVLNRLESQGVDQAYINRLEKLALSGCSPWLLKNEKKVKEFLAHYMTANLPVRKWPPTEVPGRVMVFVGLSGSGKTSSMAKVAVFYTSLLNKKAVWICADTIRTGAITEAKSYTGAMGIPLELVYTPADIRPAIERHADADLILMDTPGFNPVIEAQEIELGSLLSEVPEASILLVTSATAKECDTMSCFQSLKYFGLKGSVITKLDETTSYGSVFNFTNRSHLPLTFFTNSRKASNGLKVASTDLLVDSLFGKGW